MAMIKIYKQRIKVKPNGPGTAQTVEKYVMRPFRYTTIDVNDLADHIAADSRIERSKVAVITDSLIKQIEEMVLNGHRIVVPHLGSFKPRIKSKQAFTPDAVDAGTFVAKIGFRPSTEMKLTLQSVKFETINKEDIFSEDYTSDTPSNEQIRTEIAAKAVEEFKRLNPEQAANINSSNVSLRGTHDTRASLCFLCNATGVQVSSLAISANGTTVVNADISDVGVCTNCAWGTLIDSEIDGIMVVSNFDPAIYDGEEVSEI